MRTEAVRLFQGEMREMLAQIPPASIDAVITSPPYWHQRRYEVPDVVWDDPTLGCDHVWLEMRQYQDSPVRPFSRRWSESDPADTRNERWITSWRCSRCSGWLGQLGLEPALDCLGWARGVLSCHRCYVCNMRTVGRALIPVLATGASVILIVGDTTSTVTRRTEGVPPDGNQCLVPERLALGWQADGWMLHQTGIWAKNNVPPAGNIPGKWRRGHETILHFTRGKPHTSNLMPLHGSVFTKSVGRAVNGHVAPGSEALAYALLATLRPGTVLDPFCGEGTVGRAALRAGSQFVGIDLSRAAYVTAQASMTMGCLDGQPPLPGQYTSMVMSHM